MAYKAGVSTGSIPILDLRRRGVDPYIRVGNVECRIATGAIENGKVHEGRDFKVDIRDRGGWVEGVRMSFVRAMSTGARTIPAIPAAETATRREATGDDEEDTSRPPMVEYAGGATKKEEPGSGSARRALKSERTKDVNVDKRIECMYVLLVPFQIPQEPSDVQREDTTAIRAEGDVMLRVCEEVWEVSGGVAANESDREWECW